MGNVTNASAIGVVAFIVTLIVKFMRSNSYVITTFILTNGSAIIAEYVTVGNSSYESALGIVTSGIAGVGVIVRSFSCVSASGSVTVGIAGIAEYVAYNSFITAVLNVTSSIAFIAEFVTGYFTDVSAVFNVTKLIASTAVYVLGNSCSTASDGITSCIAIAGPSVVSLTNESADVTSVIAIMSVLMTDGSLVSASFNVTSSIASIIVYVADASYESALAVTFLIASMVKDMRSYSGVSAFFNDVTVFVIFNNVTYTVASVGIHVT